MFHHVYMYVRKSTDVSTITHTCTPWSISISGVYSWNLLRWNTPAMASPVPNCWRRQCSTKGTLHSLHLLSYTGRSWGGQGSQCGCIWTCLGQGMSWHSHVKHMKKKIDNDWIAAGMVSYTLMDMCGDDVLTFEHSRCTSNTFCVSCHHPSCWPHTACSFLCIASSPSTNSCYCFPVRTGSSPWPPFSCIISCRDWCVSTLWQLLKLHLNCMSMHVSCDNCRTVTTHQMCVVRYSKQCTYKS